MNGKISHMKGRTEKAWYCLEFFDEARGHHSFSAAHTTEEQANRVLREADRIAPPTTSIYLWRVDEMPFFRPPGGYEEGPLADKKK